MMHIKPFENKQLYGMENNFNEIINLYNKKKMPNKILLSGKKGVGKSTLAYHIINYILSIDEEFKYDTQSFSINKDNRSYKLIQNHSHTNVYLIDLVEGKKSIDISQIREMITYTNKSSFNDKPRFILIDNIENLNTNSINALLKIIEDPNDNVFFFLIHNNEKTILPTLKSRCLTFKINHSFEKSIQILNLLVTESVFDLINHDLISHYTTPGETINLINFANEKKINLKEHKLKELINILIDNAYYKKNKFVTSLIINFIELYFLKEYKISTTKTAFLNIYHKFLDKIYYTKKFNLDEESLFLEFKSKLLNG